MTTPDSAEAVNVRIAELCGWTDFTFRGMLKPVELDYIAHGPAMKDGWRGPIPNYSGSLDAMHEAEKTLTATECKRYIEELSVVSHNISRLGQAKYDAQNYAFHATAAQRAVAFLTTKTRTN